MPSEPKIEDLQSRGESLLDEAYRRGYRDGVTSAKARMERKDESAHDKFSLYGLSIEEAVRAAAATGKPSPLEEIAPKRQRKKPATAERSG